MNNGLVFAAITSDAYIPQAQVLAESIEKWHPEAKISFMHYSDSYINAQPGYDLNAKLAYLRWTSVLELLDTHLYVVYLGADTKLYDRIDRFVWKTHQNNVVLTPHLLTPRGDTLQVHKSGLCNTDVIGFRSTPSVVSFLSWVRAQSIDDKYRDLAHDQIWLNFAPMFLDNVRLERGPQYNFAYWNAKERGLEYFEQPQGKGEPRPKMCIGDPITPFEPEPWLAIAHFSGMTFNDPKRMSKYYTGPDAEGDVLQLYEEYAEEVQKKIEDAQPSTSITTN